MSGYAEWSPFTTYLVNDIVSYDGAIWVSLLGVNLNNQPDVSPLYWAIIGGGGALSEIFAGPGIAVTGTGSTRTVSQNIVSADARLTITSGVGTQRILTNTCPAAVAAGSGLALSGTNPSGVTLSMPNVGTPNTFAYPASITTDTQGRVSAVTAGSAPVASVTAGTGITVDATIPSAPVVNIGAAGTAGTYAYPTSVQTNAQGQVVAISAGSAPSAPGSYVPTPANNVNNIPTNVVPLLYNTSTLSNVISSNPLMRYFQITIPAATGGGVVTIIDGESNVYNNQQWICIVAGFYNQGGDRTFGCHCVYGSPNWGVSYDQAGSDGYVYILAINRAFLCSAYPL